MGTIESLAQVAAIIQNGKEKKVVVVSAMCGVTNQLLEATELAMKGRRPAVNKLLAKIAARHIETAQHFVSDTTKLADLIEYITSTVKGLEEFLKAIAFLGELTPISTDTVMAVGERLSSRLLAAILTAQGMPAAQLDLQKAIKPIHKTADHAFYVNAEKVFAQSIKQAMKGGVTPVATGYFGRVPGGMLAQVGRGYSDFCGALAAAGMRAERFEIWTDVSGILSADPRKVKNAKIIDTISSEAAAELAHFGAKVIHPQSIHPAIRANVPVWIKNTFRPQDRGTEIVREIKKPKNIFTSITSKKGVTVVNIASYRMLMQYGFLAKIFEIFARYKVSIDVVSTSEVSVSLVIEDTVHLKDILAELKPFSKTSVAKEKAIICLIGLGMAKQKGVAAGVFNILAKTGISVDQISQGANEINITFVVDGYNADKAVCALHKKCF